MSDAQLGLNLDAAAAEAAADEAIRRVRRNAGEEEMTRLIAAVLAAAERNERFTADDVWPHLVGDPPREPRAMGAAFREVKTRRKAVPSGDYRKSRNPASHARPMAVWTSFVYDPEKGAAWRRELAATEAQDASQ